MTPFPGGSPSFLHLNVDRRWDGFTIHGLDTASAGELRLRPLPRVRTALPDGLRSAIAPSAPAGVASAPDGSVLFTGGAGGSSIVDRVLRTERCDGSTAPMPCIGGTGTDPVRLSDPRGLLVHERWGQVLVADAGNGRVQRFDLETSQLVGIWGAADGLAEPTALAPDGSGGVLVVDTGRNAVLAFDAFGRGSRGPWLDPAVSSPGTRLIGIATVGSGSATVVYLLDAGTGHVLVCGAAGQLLASFGDGALQQSLAIAATHDAVYVGDNRLRRVLVFGPGGEAVGEVAGYRGPVGALAVAPSGDLLVHPGAPLTPLACAPGGAWSRSGRAWGGPFANPGPLARAWHLVTAVGEVPAGAHLQLFVYAARDGGASPGPTPEAPWAAGATPLAATLPDDRLADERWIAVPLDASAAVVHALKRPAEDGLPPVGSAAAATRLTQVWVGIELSSDGTATPSVDQLRIDFDVETGLGYLPAIYADDAASSRFLGRYLALGGSVFDDVERRISALPARFDSVAAPHDALAPLAGWLGLDIDGEWNDAELRAAIAEAFDAYGRRGTVAGLAEAVRRYARTDVHVQEALVDAGWWMLPDDPSPGAGLVSAASDDDPNAPALGFTTMLAAVQPQGAVLGTTAVIDGAQLLADDELGTGLFSNLADRFTVLVYQGARYSPERLAEIRAVIDREKPAATVYDVCVVEPAARVGYQSRLGIDTVIAGDALPTPLGDGGGTGLVLGGELPAAIGDAIEVGRSTRLTDWP